MPTIDELLKAAHGSLDRSEQLSPTPQKPTSGIAASVRAQHPGAYDDMSDDQLEAAVLAKHPDYQPQASEPPTQEGAGSRFLNSLLGTTPFNPMNALRAISHPIDTIGSMVAQPIASAMDAGKHVYNAVTNPGNEDALGRGTELFQAARSLGGAAPLIGGTAVNAGDKIGAGDIAGGAGELAGLASGAALPGAVSRGAGVARSATRGLLNAAAEGGESAAGYLRDLPGAGPKLNMAADAVDLAGKAARRFTTEPSPVTSLADDIGPARARSWKPTPGFGDSAEGVSGAEPSPVDRYSPNTSGYEQSAAPTPPTDPIEALKKAAGLTDEPDMSVVPDAPVPQDVPSAAEVEALVKSLFPQQSARMSAPAEVDLSGDVAPSGNDAMTDPSRMLPGFGQTSETFKPGISSGRQLRPGQNLFDLVKEYSAREGLPKVLGLNKNPMPTGNDELARAIRQRGHVSSTAAGTRKSAVSGLQKASGQ